MAAAAMVFTPSPPSLPAFSTSPVATPSGNFRSLSIISARRSGIVKSTPSTPPAVAMAMVSPYSKVVQ